MDHNTEENKKIINLLKTARGHIDAIIKMIEDDRYCIDVSHQIFAVQGILKKANLTLLRQHMANCVANSIDNKDAEKKLNEITKILEISME